MIRELKGKFGVITEENVARASRYIHLTGDDLTDYTSIAQLELLRENVLTGKSNDISKYNVGEAYKVRLQYTVNARSLQNFLVLRSAKDALWEIRLLAAAIYQSLPHDHKFLFTDYMHTKILP